jgi:enoyl-CoA hydratase/carnithine racemase
MTSPVTYALTDGIGVITMDDGKANAVSPTLQAGLNAALDQAEKIKLPLSSPDVPEFCRQASI